MSRSTTDIVSEDINALVDSLLKDHEKFVRGEILVDHIKFLLSLIDSGSLCIRGLSVTIDPIEDAHLLSSNVLPNLEEELRLCIHRSELHARHALKSAEVSNYLKVAGINNRYRKQKASAAALDCVHKKIIPEFENENAVRMAAIDKFENVVVREIRGVFVHAAAQVICGVALAPSFEIRFPNSNSLDPWKALVVSNSNEEEKTMRQVFCHELISYARENELQGIGDSVLREKSYFM